ncbi:NADPH-dependent FMN reductase [Bordetella genomosp. 10]|uniref:NADPH-dependent FMN reductase n=1 Tax=Bordetella genomosp. 10 TaxID=1416804 RepID=UPI001C52CDE1|nr:NADPH-dependent FMN reductase [Bordetella genomosp. 10]
MKSSTSRNGGCRWTTSQDIPALGRYTQAHTLAWSEKIQGAAAVAFITPQFNWGYPAVLKNAIDHLYREWREKPTMIVTYGGHGGTRCDRQLRRVAAAVGMSVVPTTPTLRLPDPVIREGAMLDPDRHFQDAIPKVTRAFMELKDRIDDHENALTKSRRKWKAFIARIS